MGNLKPITKMPSWQATPLLSKSLDSQQLMKHRAMVGFELEVAGKKVDRFGWERERGTPIQERIIKDWMKVLCDYSIEEIQDAIGEALAKYPTRVPNENYVKQLIIEQRAKTYVAQPRSVENFTEQTQQISAKPINPDKAESAARILREVAASSSTKGVK